jgi:hypothetical protein
MTVVIFQSSQGNDDVFVKWWWYKKVINGKRMKLGPISHAINKNQVQVNYKLKCEKKILSYKIYL